MKVVNSYRANCNKNKSFILFLMFYFFVTCINVLSGVSFKMVLQYHFQSFVSRSSVSLKVLSKLYQFKFLAFHNTFFLMQFYIFKHGELNINSFKYIVLYFSTM